MDAGAGREDEREMEELILINPTEEYADEIAEYRKEFLCNGSSMDGTGALSQMENPCEWIQHTRKLLSKETLPAGWVQATQYMCVRKSDNLGLSKVLITCLDDNAGSRKTIVENGGVYETTVLEPNENVKLERYWIEVK